MPLSLVSAVVLRDDNGRVLLVKENYGNRRWALPGGVVEPDESPADAAMREALEETGFRVALDYVIGVYYVRTDRPGLRLMFAGHVAEGEPAVPETGEIADLHWFPPDDLPTEIWPSARVAIGDATASVRGRFRDVTPD